MKKNLSLLILILFSTTLLFGQKTFENKKFGFSMQEPKDWIAATNDELKDSLKSFDISEENIAKMTQKGTILLTAYYKYSAEEAAGVNPKIQIDIRPKNTKDFQQFKTSLTKSAESIKRYFEDYEFIEEPKEVVISGIKSVYFAAKFTLKTQTGEQLKVRAKVYSIPYKTYFFQVNFVDGQVEPDNSKLYDELVKTIRIGN